MKWLQLVHGTTPQSPPAVGPGDEVRVWFKILEQGKERFGQFEGIVIRVRGSGVSHTFTVRRVTHGEGVERVFPLDAKVVSRIEVLRKGTVRRSRLYFLRTVIGKTRIASAEPSPSVDKPTDSLPTTTHPTDVEASPEKSQRVVASADNPVGSAKPST